MVVVRFGGGVRRRETIDPDHTFSPYLLRELAPRGTLCTRMEFGEPSIEPSHGTGTLTLLTGVYEPYRDVDGRLLGERYEARVPTLVEYLRKATGIPAHRALIVNGEDRPDEEFYTSGNHPAYGAPYRASVLSLYRFRVHLLRRAIESGEVHGVSLGESELAEKRAQLDELLARDHRLARARGASPAESPTGAQAPEIERLWERWHDHYGASGLRHPRGDRALTALALDALATLRPRFLMINYNDCDYVHWGNPTHYTRGISIMDEGLARIISAIDSDEAYRDRTIVVVVPDCGRDANPYMAVPFQHHGNNRSTRELFALFLGPGIPAGREVDRTTQQTDVAPDRRPSPGPRRRARRRRRPRRGHDVSEAVAAMPIAPAVDRDREGRLRRLARLASWALLGGLLAQTIAGAIVVVGWTQRLVRRSVLRRWWQASPTGGGASSLEAFAVGRRAIEDVAERPRWILRPRIRAGLRNRAGEPLTRRASFLLGSLVHGLGLNLSAGARAALNAWALTAPAGALWLFAWWAGWDNSFHKGYEQAWIAPAIGFGGVAVFVLAMLHLPVALAHQAATGRTAAFWDVATVRTLVRERWVACAGLAALHAAAGLPVLVLHGLPLFLGQSGEPDPDPAGRLAGIAFWALVLYVVPAYVALRLAAGRVYAGAVLARARRGDVPPGPLGEVLIELECARSPAPPESPWVLRFLARVGNRTGRAIGGAVAASLWFLFVAQIFVGQFLHHVPVATWLVHPLIQLPWFEYPAPGPS